MNDHLLRQLENDNARLQKQLYQKDKACNYLRERLASEEKSRIELCEVIDKLNAIIANIPSSLK